RAVAILHPLYYAYEGLLAEDDDQAIAGLEATAEWYEQRSDEGLIPGVVLDFALDYVDQAVDDLGGSKTTRTFCLSDAEDACVTAVLKSIRWELAGLRTLFQHDFSYSFAGGDPDRIEVRYKYATGGVNCSLIT